MKKFRQTNILLILLGSLFLISCEKVIDIDLNEAATKMVIEGNITSDAGPYQVSLSTSGGYFDNAAVQPIENGVITISDFLGGSETLTEIEPGIYSTTDFTGIEEMNYTITVEVNGEVYTGSEYLPHKIEIDTLEYEIDEFNPNSDEEEYNILCTFTDPVQTEDYYRFVAYVNGEMVERNNNRSLIIDDELFNGLTFTIPIRGTEALPGDVVRLELHSIGYNTYVYLSGLNDALSGGGMGSTPYNPTSNINNGALGYFGAYNISAQEITIQ
jgi:hypothetical protein